MATKKRVVRQPSKGSAFPKKSRKISRNKSVQSIKTPPRIFQRQPQQPNEGTAITAAPRPQTTEIISAPTPDVELVNKWHGLDGEALGEHIERQFKGICLTLRQLLPWIEEMKRRFNLLPRGKQVDGAYKTIRGCRSFKEWVETKLKRSERTVYYLLAGGNPQNEKAKLHRKAAKQRDKEPPRKARHAVTLTVGSTQLEADTNKTKQAFGSDLKGVEKQTLPSSHSVAWAKAIEEIKNAQSTIEVLRDDTLKTVNDTSKNSQDASWHEAGVRAFEEVINHLDKAAGEVGNAYMAFSHIGQVRGAQRL